MTDTAVTIDINIGKYKFIGEEAITEHTNTALILETVLLPMLEMAVASTKQSIAEMEAHE